jgi:pyruvate dehydrogenase E2 component (dihydrolipoamide acetyltransferase)
LALSVVMPALEMAQETGKLVAWRKQEGERVTRGEPLMEIETDKAVVEVEAEGDGILGGLRAKPGDIVAVGRTIAWILAPGEQPPAADDAAPAARQAGGTAAAPPSRNAPAGASAPAEAPRPERAPMSPRARRLAAEAAAARAAVQDASVADRPPASAPAQAAGGTTWRIMAERMTAAWTSIPHFYVRREIDAAALAAWRERPDAKTAGVTLTDLLVALVARTLRQHPRVNAAWLNGSVHYNDAVHIGVAVAVDDGVVVPVIRDADQLAAEQIAARRRELLERARAGRLRPEDLSGGTFTISNLGMYDIDAFSAIVNPPQAAILAVGRVADRVVARGGHAVVRPIMDVTLSCDHRVVDGARAAEFLRALATAAEQGERADS